MSHAAEAKKIPTSEPTDTSLVQWYQKDYTGTIPVREPAAAQCALADALPAHTALPVALLALKLGCSTLE